MAYIPRRFPQLISSVPAYRLIRPTARRSIRASKQARQDGGRSSAVLGPAIVSPPRPVIAPVSPLMSACGAKGVSFPSAPCRHRARAFPHRSPWLKRFNHSSPRARSHHGKQAGKGGPSPVPPLVPAGGKPSVNAPHIGRRGVPRGSINRHGGVSKQAGGSRSVRPPRACPATHVDPVARPRARRLIDDKGKQNAPLPLSRNGAKSVRPLYRTRLL